MRAALLVAALGLALVDSGAGEPDGAQRYRPPRAAFAPVRLDPLPRSGLAACRKLQRRVPFTALCARRLPRATLAPPWRPRWAKARFRAELVGDTFHPARPGPIGVDFAYGAPVEPQSRDYFRCCRWLNRPAYFLHFDVFRRGVEPLPQPLYRRCFDRRCGWISYATGYGRGLRSGFYWANHTWFFWRERGVRWAASLHYFGRGETTALLARILRELRPVRSL